MGDKIHSLKGQVFLHITPASNRKSIVSSGLTIGNKPSGYGKQPLLKGIYLYHENNINVIYDMINLFEDLDIWELRNLCNLNALPDEDSKETTWERSLQAFGTLAYMKNIPAKNLQHKLTIHNVNFKPN